MKKYLTEPKTRKGVEMKKIMFVLVAVNLCFLMTYHVVTAAETKKVGGPENLLKNSDFEEVVKYVISEPEFKDSLPGVTEIPKGYGINYASYPGKLTVIYDAETSHSGDKYIRLEQEAAAGIGFMCHTHSTRHIVKPGEKYSVSCWAKGTGKMHILAYAYTDVGGSFPTLDGGEIEVFPEWKEYKWEFTVKEGMAGFILAFHATGVVDLDDVGLFMLKN